MFSKKSSRGFTLIELLVVISIIGTLSSIVLASLTTVRSRARDIQRRSDLIQIRNAIVLYESDNNGSLPPHGYDSVFYQTAGSNDWPAFQTLLGSSIKLPSDPQGNTSSHYYFFSTPSNYNQWGGSWVNVGSGCNGKSILVAFNIENSSGAIQDCVMLSQTGNGSPMKAHIVVVP